MIYWSMNEASLSALQFFSALGSLLMIRQRPIVNKPVYYWTKFKRDPKILYNYVIKLGITKKKSTMEHESICTVSLVLVTMEHWYDVLVWDSVIIHLLLCDQICKDGHVARVCKLCNV